jgi:hypothetical protein
LREIRCQDVCLMEVEMGESTELALKAGDEGCIHLNGVQFFRARQQMPGQGAASGADFDHSPARGTANSLGDAVQNASACQKVLAEFTRHVSVTGAKRGA